MTKRSGYVCRELNEVDWSPETQMFVILKAFVTQSKNTGCKTPTDGSPSPLSHRSISGSAFAAPAVNTDMSTVLLGMP